MRGCEGRLRGKGKGVGRVREGHSGSFRRTGVMWLSPAPPALHLHFAFHRAPFRHATVNARSIGSDAKSVQAPESCLLKAIHK